MGQFLPKCQNTSADGGPCWLCSKGLHKPSRRPVRGRAPVYDNTYQQRERRRVAKIVESALDTDRIEVSHDHDLYAFFRGDQWVMAGTITCRTERRDPFWVFEKKLQRLIDLNNPRVRFIAAFPGDEILAISPWDAMLYPRKEDAGRSDRPEDPQSIEPAYLVPLSAFKPIKAKMPTG